MKSPTQLSKRLRQLGNRDQWICWLCGQPVPRKRIGRHRASADHILPVALGGTRSPDNLRLAHQSCNSYRSGSEEEPFAPIALYLLTDRQEMAKLSVERSREGRATSSFYPGRD